MKNDTYLIPIVFLCMFVVPLMAFLWGSIYLARQPIDVHRIVAECLADPKCAR